MATTIENRVIRTTISKTIVSTGGTQGGITYTPTGATQTIILSSGPFPTLILESVSGDLLTLTLTAPSVRLDGILFIEQRSTTACDLTILSNHPIVWVGTEPSWLDIPLGEVKTIPWCSDGISVFLGGNFSGEITAEFEVFGLPIGDYEAGDVITANTNIEDVLKIMLQGTIEATYTNPTMSHSTDVDLVLAQLYLEEHSGSIWFEEGRYMQVLLTPDWDQNDAGTASAFRLKKNGTTIYTLNQYYDAGLNMVGNTAFVWQVDYAAGAQKQNNKGVNSGSPVASGTATSNTVTFLSKRFTFAGTNTSTATPTYLTVRDLIYDQPVLGSVEGDSFSIIMPANTRKVMFAYPATLRDVTSVRYNGMEIKDLFTKTVMDIPGGDGVGYLLSYKVFHFIPEVALEVMETLTVTI